MQVGDRAMSPITASRQRAMTVEPPGSARACSDQVELEHAPDSSVWSHFLRRTGAHFGGKCSRRKIAAAALACGLLLAGAAWADSDTTPPGDVAAGKTAAANCAACHGLDGISRQAGAPSLAGQ